MFLYSAVITISSWDSQPPPQTLQTHYAVCYIWVASLGVFSLPWRGRLASLFPGGLRADWRAVDRLTSAHAQGQLLWSVPHTFCSRSRSRYRHWNMESRYWVMGVSYITTSVYNTLILDCTSCEAKGVLLSLLRARSEVGESEAFTLHGSPTTPQWIPLLTMR